MGPDSRAILIGVHLTDSTQDIASTLRAIHENTSRTFELAVLVDPAPGALEPLTELLEPLAGTTRWPITEPGGGAASFNRLICEDAGVYLLLEAGARPAPGWLEHLMAVLEVDAAHGLAGPTTNWCWNEQGAAHSCGPTSAELAREAQAVRTRFGASWRSMAPLYSLSDFCLAVRRSVIEAIGAADTAYGRGPCWEMDYGIRAARAGFHSIWAQSALVQRGPMPTSRHKAEAALLEVNKRLYQDRFCGWRARAGAGAPYHSHCRGEACPDFAPAEGVRVRLPRPDPPASPGMTVRSALPLITCAMPTRGRPRFVAQSIEYFQRQDYPNRELVIVYEEESDLPGDVNGSNIRAIRVERASVGAKREAAALAARGEIIAHWDDDDWYAPTRLSRQVQPILQGAADITGLSDILFMLISKREFWSVTPDLFARLFVANVAGGSLMFRRSSWARSRPYPATSLREDCDFMVKALRDGARLCPIPGRELCIYVRHDRNTWSFAEGRYLQPRGWSRVPEPDFLALDRTFYFGTAAAPNAVPSSACNHDGPLVSCIMPTANRRPFVTRALAQFLMQDYPRCELIVIDDGEDPISDLIPPEPSIRYVRLERRRALGAKRNIACELARGEVIAHWDDDDWRAPQWLSSQLGTLLPEGCDVCGLDKVLFYAPATRQGWRYVYDGTRPWLCGGTLCYTKTYWSRSPFREINVGEDNEFVWSRQPKRLSTNGSEGLYVATIHRGNVSPKHTNGHRWQPLSAHNLRALIRTMEEARREAGLIPLTV